MNVKSKSLRSVAGGFFCSDRLSRYLEIGSQKSQGRILEPFPGKVYRLEK
jgi:hypothetical protein